MVLGDFTFRCWSFDPFYHEPADLDAVIKGQKMEEIDSRTTPVWQVKMFKRRIDARDGTNEPRDAGSNLVFAA